MNAVDIFSAAGGYGVGALLLAFCALITSVVLAVVKGMGSWVPAALWMTTPALVLTVGAFGAAEAGQAAGLELAQAASADHLVIAAAAWPDIAAGLVVSRVCAGIALLLIAGAVFIGHVVGRLQVEQNPERERQWVCARVLLGTTLLSGIACLVAGVALGRDVSTGAELGAMAPARLDDLRLGGLVVVALGGALMFAAALPSWRQLVKRRSLVGIGLCALLLAGVGGAEAVAIAQKLQLERIQEAPVDSGVELDEEPESAPP